MRNFFKNMTNKIRMATVKAQTAVSSAVSNENGDFYISDGVKVIIAVVLGALLLAALTLLFNSTIIPRITEEITGLFG